MVSIYTLVGWVYQFLDYQFFVVYQPSLFLNFSLGFATILCTFVGIRLINYIVRLFFGG